MADSSRRNVSRQSSTTAPRHGRRGRMTSMLTSPLCRLFMTMAVVFCAGVLFGVYLNAHLESNATGMGLLAWRYARDASAGDRRDTAKREAGGTGPEGEGEEVGRPGQSIKKDLSIQFRDYLPRRVFIASSLDGPRSLELFVETYPESHQYLLHAFLADSSYAALYDTFPNLTLHPSTVLAAEQNSTIMLRLRRTSSEGENRTWPVHTVDFPAWLKDNVHLDDYVIVTLTAPDPGVEAEVMSALDSTGSVEWVDKLYVTTEEAADLAKETFAKSGLEVLMWDDDLYTYSDFNAVNPPPATRGRKEVGTIPYCPVKVDSPGSSFALLLYFPSINKHASTALRLLSTLSASLSQTLPVTVFLPVDYLESSSSCASLSELGTQAELGLYLHQTSFSGVRSKDPARLRNLVRNKLVSVEHCFSRHNLTLQFLLSESSVLDVEKGVSEMEKLLTKLTQQRGYTVMGAVRDLTPTAQDDSQVSFPGEGGEMSPGKEAPLLALDVSVQGAEDVLLRVLTSRVSSLVSMKDCVAPWGKVQKDL